MDSRLIAGFLNLQYRLALQFSAVVKSKYQPPIKIDIKDLMALHKNGREFQSVSLANNPEDKIGDFTSGLFFWVICCVQIDCHICLQMQCNYYTLQYIPRKIFIQTIFINGNIESHLNEHALWLILCCYLTSPFI